MVNNEDEDELDCDTLTGEPGFLMERVRWEIDRAHFGFHHGEKIQVNELIRQDLDVSSFSCFWSIVG